MDKPNPSRDTLGTTNTNSNLKGICLTHTAIIVLTVNSLITLNTQGMINTLDTAQRFSNDASLFASC